MIVATVEWNESEKILLSVERKGFLNFMAAHDAYRKIFTPMKI